MAGHFFNIPNIHSNKSRNCLKPVCRCFGNVFFLSLVFLVIKRRLVTKGKFPAIYNRCAFEPSGRKVRKKTVRDRWRKQKQKEGNRIEGYIGYAKEHFDLEKIRYYIEGGAEIWVRLGILGMNLKTAEARCQDRIDKS